MEIGIVILNYLNWKDTVECIDSLKDQTNQNFKIVIVDNNSDNESVDELRSRYENTEQIHLLVNKENLGFAKGNNTGILYCKTILNINNILVINNDVIFTDKDYIDYLINYPINDNIGVVGTEIIGSDGKNQNPRYFNPTFKSVFREFLSPIINSNLANEIRKIRDKRKSKPQTSTTNKSPLVNNTKGLILHGSVLYFTENYIQRINGFYPETFLYYEEEILALVCHKLGLKMEYDSTKSIYHKEDQSSQISFQNLEKVKRKFARRSVRIGLKVSLLNRKSIQNVINSEVYETYLLKDQEKRKFNLG